MGYFADRFDHFREYSAYLVAGLRSIAGMNQVALGRSTNLARRQKAAEPVADDVGPESEFVFAAHVYDQPRRFFYLRQECGSGLPVKQLVDQWRS